MVDSEALAFVQAPVFRFLQIAAVEDVRPWQAPGQGAHVIVALIELIIKKQIFLIHLDDKRALVDALVA